MGSLYIHHHDHNYVTNRYITKIYRHITWGELRFTLDHEVTFVVPSQIRRQSCNN